MNEWLSYVVAPLLSGFIGWFANSYRNKQRKESDQIEIAKQYKELLKESLDDKKSLYQKIDSLRFELTKVKEEVAVVKEERAVMKLAISRAGRCQMSAQCPVFREISSEV